MSFSFIAKICYQRMYVQGPKATVVQNLDHLEQEKLAEKDIVSPVPNAHRRRKREYRSRIVAVEMLSSHAFPIVIALVQIVQVP